jgi:hypothetical protein
MLPGGINCALLRGMSKEAHGVDFEEGKLMRIASLSRALDPFHVTHHAAAVD